jgi:hypothetical protein
MRVRRLAAFLAMLAGLALAGDKGFKPPAATHAKTYPAFESHNDENVSIAVDPYDQPPHASVFHVNYRQNGFLVLRLIISNDGAKPLMLDSLKINYITGRRDKLDPATTNDIVRRLSHPSRPDRPQVRLPGPIPRKSHNAVSKETMEEVESALFVSVPVTPHSTNSGFLFFDVQDIDDFKTGAHLYVSGIKAGSQQLFYFDIPLEEALSSQQSAISPKN